MPKNYLHQTEIYSVEDADGNVQTTTKETLTKIQRSEEPDYIKLYTKIWAEFNGIPDAFQGLFLQLALRMTYADTTSFAGGQIVYTGGSTRKAIMQQLSWKSDTMFVRGLSALVKCHALKKIGRAEYQINPSYAGKGEWKYNPRLQRGGIEDLVATFNFKDKTVDTQIIWADDGKQSEFNDQYRQGLHVKAEQNTILKTSTIIPNPSEASANLENNFDEILQGQFWNGKIYKNNKIYLNNTEIILTDTQVDLLKTHEKYQN